MQDNLANIERLVREHEQALSGIQACNKSINGLIKLRQNWIPGMPGDPEQKLGQLQATLDSLVSDFQEHMRFEEQEFLPVLVKHAGAIISRGLLFEHRNIIDSITEVRQSAGDLSGQTANREELLTKESEIRESIASIIQLIQEHAQVQEVIFNLAREALAQEAEQNRQP